MRRSTSAWVAAVCGASLLFVCLGPAGARRPPNRPSHEPRSLRGLLVQRRAATPATSSILVAFERDAPAAEVRSALANVHAHVVGGLSHLGNVKILDVNEASAAATMHALAEDPHVVSVERDVLRVPLAIPDDPQFDDQWGLHNTGQKHPIADPYEGFPKSHAGRNDADIDAPQAWSVEDGSSNETIVAVLDQGFDVTHPDIANSRWTNPYEVPGNGRDDDRNGYVDDVRGWDFTGSGDPNPNDPGTGKDRGHGTHVAATATGTANDGKGIAGTCPRCKLLPLRFGLTLRQELEALDYLIGLLKRHPKLEIQVLNLSFGSWQWSPLERRALDRLGARGVLTVAAAGNGALDNDMFDAADFGGDGIPDEFSPQYPASYDLPKILAVAASNDRDQLGYLTGCDAHPRVPRYRCMFSNWGRTSVDVAAPGVDIKSAFLSDAGDPRFRTWSGTSMAAPIASGIAGLVAAERPGLGPLGIKNAIMNSVDRPSSLQKVWHRSGGADEGSFLRTNGRVNALSALSGNTADATPTNDGLLRGARRIRGFRRGSVRWPADVNDVYRRHLQEGVRYAASVRASEAKRNVNLVVYKPGTKEIWQLEDGCYGGGGICHGVKPFAGLTGDGTERVVFTASRTGTYFFHVSSYFTRSGYRLRIARAG